jgi:hypothetical protein
MKGEKVKAKELHIQFHKNVKHRNLVEILMNELS